MTLEKAKETVKQESAMKAHKIPDFSLKIKDAAIEYAGDVTVLQAAIGVLYTSQIYGWRVIRMIHSPNVIKKYEAILDVKFDDSIAPEYGPLADRTNVRKFQKMAHKFSEIVQGRISVPGGRTSVFRHDFDNRDLTL